MITRRRFVLVLAALQSTNMGRERTAHPGGNVNGTAYVSPETMAKGMQLLKEIVPQGRRVAILWSNARSTRKFEQVVRTSLDRAAGNLGLSLRYFEIRRPEDIAGALEQIASSKFDALWYQGSSILRTRTEQIIAALLEQKVAVDVEYPVVRGARRVGSLIGISIPKPCWPGSIGLSGSGRNVGLRAA